MKPFYYVWPWPFNIKRRILNKGFEDCLDYISIRRKVSGTLTVSNYITKVSYAKLP